MDNFLVLYSFIIFIIPNINLFLQVVVTAVSLYCIVRFKISGQKVAIVGFFLSFLSMVFNILALDNFAGIVAQYIWISFAIAFIEEFLHFLKYENKSK